jgi:hypothetical protein
MKRAGVYGARKGPINMCKMTYLDLVLKRINIPMSLNISDIAYLLPDKDHFLKTMMFALLLDAFWMTRKNLDYDEAMDMAHRFSNEELGKLVAKFRDLKIPGEEETIWSQAVMMHKKSILGAVPNADVSELDVAIDRAANSL